MLRMTAYCNSGVLLEYNGHSILLDGLSADYSGFVGLSSADYVRIVEQTPPFDRLCGLFFSHRHPDHFDPKRVEQLKKQLPDCLFFIPDQNISQNGCIQCGPFSVFYFETPHMLPQEPEGCHVSFLIKAGTDRIYFTGDADSLPVLPQDSQCTCMADYMVANYTWVTAESTRALLSRIPLTKLFLCHLPENTPVASGIRRKAERCLKRHQNALPPSVLITHYPMRLV